jgi:sulfoxide reductase heme-binding subunit YedZ
VHVLAAVGTNSKAMWYLTRGTGLVALLLLTLTLVLGITQAVRYARPGLPRMVVSGLHRNASLVAVALVAVHVITAVLDTFAPISIVNAFIPFTGTYRPLWLGFGALAFDLMLALIVTSLLRDRLGLRAWRIVHWAAYACWPVALAHGLGTGTDTHLGWVLFLYVLAALTVLGALGWRLATDWSPAAAGRRSAGLLVAGVVAVGLAVFTVVGPLRHGWAKRAGTPVALLGHPTSSSAAAAPSSGSASPPATAAPAPSTSGWSPPWTANLSGTMAQRGPNADGNVTVTIQGTLSGSVSGQLQVALHGAASGGGGVSLASGNVSLGPASAPSQLTGSVTSLEGDRVAATVSGGGQHFNLDIRLQLSGSTVSGTVAATS